MEIVWSSLAQEGLIDLLEYTEQNFGRNISERVYSELMDYVRLLSRFPKLGIHDELFSSDKREVRYLIYKQNLIYYLVNKEAILLLSIANTNQSPERVRKIIADYLGAY